jgi:threonylcarbamoyladenosine tRNA methylthiotransferase MtaB
MIKIQDGCRHSCAYCIVPSVRPHEYSFPASEIIKEIKTKEAEGCKEVVLTGTAVGRYNYDGTGIRELLERILEDTHIERLRLSSLQPQELSDGLLSLWQDKRLCRHFHLALQSGSGTVLRRMKRCYSPVDYRAAVQRIWQAVPGAAVTTDVIVGFPGESDEEFVESYAFCQQIGFANIHVFPFSPREGTLAADMDGLSKDSVKKKRRQQMLELAWEARQTFCRQFLGHVLPVLWEKRTGLDNGICSGLTDNYIRVYAQGDAAMINTVTPTSLRGLCDSGMQGEPVL